MARGIRVEETSKEPEKELPCPRSCGNLTNQRKLTNLRKHYRCKKCGGTNLSIDEINAQINNRGIKKNELENFLNSGKPGELNCPTCSRKMQRIELSYDKDLLPSALDKGMMGLGGFGGPEGMIITLPILAIYGISKLASKATKKAKQKPKNLKLVVIDSCGYCNSFWFDKNEFKELNEVGASKADIEQMYSKESGHVEVAKHGLEVTPGVSIVSVAEKEPNHLTSGNKIFVDGRWVPDPSFKAVKTKKE